MSSPIPIRLLLVDDEALIRYGLRAIAELSDKIEVVGEAENGAEAIALAQSRQPDVVLMDIAMPPKDGIRNGVEATGVICQQQPDVKVLILTTHSEDEYLVQAMQQGAAGYLMKNTPPQDFIHIIQTAHRGYLQFSSDLSSKLSRNLDASRVQQGKIREWEGATQREQEVIQLIAQGANNREIAKALYIAEKTVKNHVSNILSRVGLRDRTQLAIWANNAEIGSFYAPSPQLPSTP